MVMNIINMCTVQEVQEGALVFFSGHLQWLAGSPNTWNQIGKKKEGGEKQKPISFLLN
jgi:hypothetical protein